MLRILFSLALGFISLSSLAQASEPSSESTSEASASEAAVTTEQDQRLPLRELRLFTQVFEQIRQGYVEEVSDTQLLENAIAGLLTELDPHSVYLNEESYGDLEENSSGEYGGLGLEVATQDGVIRVVSPIDDSPAAEAGIEAGDLIVKMNGNPVRGMSLQKAIEKMRGEKGTSIKLTVYREGEDDTIDIDVVRDIIQVSAVRNRLLEPGFGHAIAEA